jgi:flagellar basal body-associated protein FliL
VVQKSELEATPLLDRELDGTDEARSNPESVDESSKPKRKKRLNVKILGVVIAAFVVLGAAGGGAYLGFHDQPWFCNFVCHTPMDPYVASYEEGVSVNAAQADSGTLLSVTLHKDSEQNLNCLQCHVPSLDEQITEGIKWVTGDYELPLNMTLVAGQLKAGSGDKSGPEFCLREGCHTGITSVDDLKAATADQARNPHSSHLGNQDCSSCHQTHEQSVMLCSQCHTDAVVPDGWLTYQEQQKQVKKTG